MNTLPIENIIFKTSEVAGEVPSTNDIQLGEIFVNAADSVLFIKRSDNTIATFNSDLSESLGGYVSVDGAGILTVNNPENTIMNVVGTETTNMIPDMGSSYAVNGFTASASSEYNISGKHHAAFLAFSSSYSDTGSVQPWGSLWHVGSSSYSSPPHWIAIELPSAEIVNGFGFAGRSDMNDQLPTTFTIEGSVDGIDWTVIKSYTDYVLGTAGILHQEMDIGNTIAYKHYRMKSDTLRSLRDLQFYKAITETINNPATTAVYDLGALGDAGSSGGGSTGIVANIKDIDFVGFRALWPAPVGLNSGDIIPFDAVDYDTNNAFSTVTHGYTVPETGYYQVNASIGGNGMNQIVIVVNGENVNGTADHDGASWNTADTNDVLYLVKGDLIQVASGGTSSSTSPTPYHGSIAFSAFKVQSNQITLTSGEVKDAPGYSTDEVLTEKRWIDGKPVYRRVFIADPTSGQVVTLGNVIDITPVGTWHKTNTNQYWSSDVTHSGHSLSYAYYADTGDINVYQTGWDNNTFVQTVLSFEYVKNSDTAESPVATPTVLTSVVASEVPDIYSTSETKTNKYWNGKPVYRKVLTGNLPTYTDESNYTMSIANDLVDSDWWNLDSFEIISAYDTNLVLTETSNWYLSTSSESGVFTHRDTKELSIRRGSSTSGSYISNSPYTFVIEYTKTTDTALSDEEIQAKLSVASSTEETTTSLSFVGDTLTYTDEEGVATEIDLSKYVDPAQATVTGGSVDAQGIATFNKSDDTTFTVDMSQFFDDTTPDLSGYALKTEAYVHPSTHSIAEIDGLQAALDAASASGGGSGGFTLSSVGIDENNLHLVEMKLNYSGATNVGQNALLPFVKFRDYGYNDTFSDATHEYIVPEDGIYDIRGAFFHEDDSDGNPGRIYAHATDTTGTRRNLFFIDLAKTVGGDQHDHFSRFVSLNVGDKVTFRIANADWADARLIPYTDHTWVSISKSNTNTTNVILTSGEVQETPGYSTDEVLTEKRWVDGKPIYRRVFDHGPLTGADDTTVSKQQVPLDIIGSTVSANVVFGHRDEDNRDYGNNDFKLQYNTQGTHFWCRFNSHTRAQTEKGVVVVVEYTKAADTTESPVATPTVLTSVVAQNVPDVYSETEVKTNKYYSGKPTYRKILNRTSPSNTTSVVEPLGMENVSDCRVSEFFIERSDGWNTSGDSHDEVFTCDIKKDGSSIWMHTRNVNNGGSRPVTIVIEYTKTTDTALSDEEIQATLTTASGGSDALGEVGSTGNFVEGVSTY